MKSSLSLNPAAIAQLRTSSRAPRVPTVASILPSAGDTGLMRYA